MKHKKHIILIIALLSLALLLAACGGGDKAEQPADTGGEKAAVSATNTPAPEPTDTPVPEPTDTPEPEQEMGLANITQPEKLFDSVRSRGDFSVDIQYASGETEEQTMTFEMDWVKTDNEYGGDMSMVMSGFGGEEEGAPDSMAIYSVGDTTSMNFGGEWMSSQRDPEELDTMPSIFQSPENFTDQLDDLEKVGKETINGIKTTHYKFKDVSLFADILEEDDLANTEMFSNVSGDIWVANDGGWVVKMAYEVSGKDIPDDGDKGPIDSANIAWNFEVYEVDTLDSIELPEDAPAPGEIGIPGFAPGEFPIPEDTTMQGGFGGVYMLESELSEEEVNAFYDDALPALGWTKEEGFMPTWSKGDISFTLLISPGDTGGTSIMIMTEEG
ncbi:MAG TPA: hypothetical protein G4N94_11345 [Caldilineae bacterium]|nr:hypothetical protein [Caldilineae bacterium]